MDINAKQLAEEFKRQVRLCSGLGREKQLQILLDYWTPAQTEKNYKLQELIQEKRGV